MSQRPSTRSRGRGRATPPTPRAASSRRTPRTPQAGRSRRTTARRRTSRARRRRRGAGRRIILAAFLVTVLVGALAVKVLGADPTGPAPLPVPSTTLTAPVPLELDMTGFDPTHLIDDDVFYDAGAMSEREVAELIVKVNTGCRTGEDGTPCLASATFTTHDVDATRYCPGGYDGAKDESAASVISKVAKACDVNPQVLLTLLQKEQGLLTASGSGLSAHSYAIATGFACPDNSSCDVTHEGFFNQVYGAAAQFQRYRLSPTTYEVVAGTPADVAYSPDPCCGSASLTVVNQATAGLYDYTPYQPNAAAADGGDQCTSWGNWNFYGLFRSLFGDPTPSS